MPRYPMDESSRQPDDLSSTSKEAGDAEPPILDPWRQPAEGLAMDPRKSLMQWASGLLGAEGYGAPRVFDLFTLLAVTLAFAILFALLRLLEPMFKDDLPVITVALSIFVTFSAIAQMTLWHGERPRLASVASGPAIWMVIGLGSAIYFLRPGLLLGTVCMSFLGVPVGYLSGALVAGVFMLADMFRTKFLGADQADQSDAVASSAAIWGNLDPKDQESP